jgi:hypothetical protein
MGLKVKWSHSQRVSGSGFIPALRYALGIAAKPPRAQEGVTHRRDTRDKRRGWWKRVDTEEV